MASEQLRERGIQAAKAKRFDEARELLGAAVRANPQDETAWLFLASVTEDKKARLACLQKVLEINPASELGRKAVQAMGVDPEKLIAVSKAARPAEPEPPAPRPALKSLKPLALPPAEPAPPSALRPLSPRPQPEGPSASEPSAEDDLVVDESAAPAEADVPTGYRLPNPPPPNPNAPPGVPVPDIDYLEEALLYAEGLVKRYTPVPPSDIQWTHKEKGRAGERDILTLRLQIAGAIFGVILVFGLIGALILAASPEAQAAILGIRTRTATLTPSRTPTNTPGLTPTPSITPNFTLSPTYTPSPTIPLTLSPAGNLIATPRPTSLYLPEPPERPVVNAVVLIDNGAFAAAAATLEIERANTSSVFNPNPYYFEARALAGAREFDDAASVVSEAEDRLDQVNVNQAASYRALVDLAQAEVEVARGEAALAARNPGGASAAFNAARERLEAVLDFDARYARAHALLARTFALEGDFGEAIAALDQARLLPELQTDVTIVLEKAQTYLRQGEALATSSPDAARAAYHNAGYQGYLAVYLNPFDELAHEIRIRAALALGDPGQAVLHVQDYLLYHPTSPRALRWLAEARTAEGNNDLALEAFTRALESSPDDAVRAEILRARAALYSQQGRDELALADLSTALELATSDELRALRLEAAYRAGDFVTAGRDAEALRGLGILPEAQLALLEARILIDEAEVDDTDSAQEALALLNSFANEALDDDQRPLADEYRARAQLRLGSTADALNSINRAISAAETGARRFLRAQILAADGQPAEALIDYEWVLAWDTVYDFDFAAAAAEGLEAAQQSIAQSDRATAEAQTATAMPTPTVSPTPTVAP